MYSPIEHIRPDNLNNEIISSWFTLRNQARINSDSSIPGLNLGLNTDEKAAVVLHNRSLLTQHIDITASQIAYATQVHKTEVQVVQQGGIYENTDGLATNRSGLALAIQVADCACVFLGDSKNKVIGAAHAGWRGAVKGILPNTIFEMVQLGAQVDCIQAFVSPCISLNNFEVGEEVASQFPDYFVHRTGFAKPHVDLKAFIKHQLMQAGIESAHILVDNHCTIENENFYSYRRQKEKSGRMMGIIKLN
jgi:YfiH family protein